MLYIIFKIFLLISSHNIPNSLKFIYISVYLKFWLYNNFISIAFLVKKIIYEGIEIMNLRKKFNKLIIFKYICNNIVIY